MNQLYCLESDFVFASNYRFRHSQCRVKHGNLVMIILKDHDINFQSFSWSSTFGVIFNVFIILCFSIVFG